MYQIEILIFMVLNIGLEPMTSCMSCKHSTTELIELDKRCEILSSFP